MNDATTVPYTANNDDDNDKKDALFIEVDDDEYIPMTNEDIDAMFE